MPYEQKLAKGRGFEILMIWRKQESVCTLFCALCALLLALCAIFYPDTVSSGTYLDSAHGNTSYGVDRTTLSTFGYSKGNCAHCHEQHASVGGNEPSPEGGGASVYALFADNFTSQSEDFCYYCHRGTGSLQSSFSHINYDFSYWFGGDTINQIQPNNVFDAFNATFGESPSSHNLQDVLNFVKMKWPQTFGNESNPCSACHNPHLSRRSYPIVRPSDRNNVWGDQAGEKMSDFAAARGGRYQAPYRYNSSSTYEPDGSVTTDGSNMPDYATFCSDCHNDTDSIYSTTLGRNLQKIGWTQESRTYGAVADYHGSVTRCFGVDGNVDQGCACSEPNCSNWGSLKEPYHSANYMNFILSCTDCHEPHGSRRQYLLRTTANGSWNNQVPPGPPTPSWERQFCLSCHTHNAHCGNLWNCLNCHYHNSYARCFACTWCATGGPHGHAF
jgi:hypothetical protein